jgi:putative nucleotidyltransferase with HDIG domain
MTLPVSDLSAARSGSPERAADLLFGAEQLMRAGSLVEAGSALERALTEAEAEGSAGLMADALRLHAVVCHHRDEQQRSQELAQRSLGLASELGDDLRAAQALNILAGFDFERGAMDSARRRFQRALALGGKHDALRGKIEQNLGSLANLQGDHAAARSHFERALAAYDAAGIIPGRAEVEHNLGMLHADIGEFEQADAHYLRSLQLSESLGNVHLRGLVLLNRADVLASRQRYDEGMQSAERALAIFNEMDSRLDKADAYQIIGRIYRETGRIQLAESRLRTATELAVATGSVLSEAETARELAMLYQVTGRNQEALRSLNTAYRLFRRLDARRELVDISGRVTRLEGTYLAVVRDWGQSIESADSYTYGHCERVAELGARLGTALGMSDDEITALRLGAYLHDLGKVKVPHEILNKPGRLTDEEFDVIRRHPEWGVELLATVDFPWDIKPIIRWHHEKYDGSGYPDRLVGDEIPLSAQIICIVDVYDALTTTRSYRPAMDTEEAIARMTETRHWWRPDVFEAFHSLMARG